MSASQQLSGNGDPNGVIDGKPGDTYQDQTGKLWVNTAAPSIWAQATTGAAAFVFNANNLGGAQQNNGTGNAATGDRSLAAGSGSTSTGFASATFGSGGTTSGDYSLTSGNTNTGGGDYSNVSGSNNTNTGDYSQVSGNQNNNSGDYSQISGNANVNDGAYALVSGNGNHNHADYAAITGGSNNTINVGADEARAAGDGNQVNGFAAAADGESNIADAEGSYVCGIRGRPIRTSQRTHASGHFTAQGDAQLSDLEMRGSTPGVAANESVELGFGFSPTSRLTLQDGKYYACDIVAVAALNGGNTTAMFRATLIAIFQEGGVATLVGSGVIANVTNVGAGAASWTLTASAGAAPSRLVLTFATGAGVTAAVRVLANVRWVEVARV